ncbi:hypothetical protein SUGI_0210080 [Cryptomeria japonica]|uniref:calmodulin-like protein 2 n=1 Tax=Cryptomeria japonica TaxID=3369 RepID=UPI002408BC54|nr:calmodulin-like protein 2 [Cryptomeria japonica]GLJ13308.1 hypothetical protein SUGI_0210080 [Cryptomeria japonica]
MADLNEIQKAYELIDENADGRVSVGEISRFIKKLGIQMSEEDVRCILNTTLSKELDDNDGLEFEEFVHLYHSIFSIEDEEIENESKDLEEAFRVFDLNNDGYISSTELQQVLSTLGLISENEHPQRCQEMIFRFDSDCNGVLDFSEFKDMMSSKLSA